jgi:hypothetical protein
MSTRAQAAAALLHVPRYLRRYVLLRQSPPLRLLLVLLVCQLLFQLLLLLCRAENAAAACPATKTAAGHQLRSSHHYAFYIPAWEKNRQRDEGKK